MGSSLNMGIRLGPGRVIPGTVHKVGRIFLRFWRILSTVRVYRDQVLIKYSAESPVALQLSINDFSVLRRDTD
jgi:hypothetical protein